MALFFRLFIFSFVLTFPLHVYASGEHYIQKHEKGWFWYEDPPEPPKEVKKKPVKHTPPKKVVKKEPEKKLKKKDPWELKPREDVAMPLQMFFKDPAKNAKNYIIWLNKLSDRGMQMVAAVEHELREDPTIFPYTTPGVTFAASQLKRLQSAEKDKIIEKYKGRFGLVVFLKADCKMCEIQVVPVNTAYKSGFEVIGITPDGLPVKGSSFPIQADAGLADKFKVKAVPSTYLVDTKAGTHRLIRVGIMAYYEFEEAMIAKIEELHLWRSPERIEPWKREDPRFKALDRHGFNPFLVYDQMTKDLNDPASFEENRKAAEFASERLKFSERGIN